MLILGSIEGAGGVYEGASGTADAIAERQLPGERAPAAGRGLLRTGAPAAGRGILRGTPVEGVYPLDI